MFRFMFITLMVFSVLCSKAKANSTIIVQKELSEASDKLMGFGKLICQFLAKEIPLDYTQKGIANISWLQFGNSFNNIDSIIKISQITSSIELLENTKSGSLLFNSLENVGIGKKYSPITIHLGDLSKLLNNNTPHAFNSIIQTKSSAKMIPFMVLNSNIYAKNKYSQADLSIVIANELYDILGRIKVGEKITATSNYQALGIILSDITLKKEVGKQNTKTDISQIIFTYKKALNNYKNDVPSLNYTSLNILEKKALDELTALATDGEFTNFESLNSSSVFMAQK